MKNNLFGTTDVFDIWSRADFREHVCNLARDFSTDEAIQGELVASVWSDISLFGHLGSTTEWNDGFARASMQKATRAMGGGKYFEKLS